MPPHRRFYYHHLLLLTLSLLLLLSPQPTHSKSCRLTKSATPVRAYPCSTSRILKNVPKGATLHYTGLKVPEYCNVNSPSDWNGPLWAGVKLYGGAEGWVDARELKYTSSEDVPVLNYGLAYRLALLSELVYYDNPDLTGTSFELVTTFKAGYDFGFLANDKANRMCVVAFRGTGGGGNLDLTTDMIWNLNVLTTTPLYGSFLNSLIENVFGVSVTDDETCLVHQGFLLPLFKLVPELMAAIEMCLADGQKQLVVTGHSRGGAIASLFALIFGHAWLRDWPKIQLYTFGEPRPLQDDKDCISARANIEKYRFIHTLSTTTAETEVDLVTQIPPSNAHFGLGVKLTSVVFESTGMTSHYEMNALGEGSQYPEPTLKATVNAHGMMNYVRALEAFESCPEGV
ncbi:hypothetical protein HDV05_003260 [Chytridiales sp. JEL 0842]|nr:hypothetical protein HDV05_003260 [Chytridiales sp. JEL 0842]